MIAEGCIYGAFQPFHNNDLTNALDALDRCQFLWFGLCNPFPPGDAKDAPGPGRTVQRSPLTFHERRFMITRVLVAEGISPERFSVTPFPIELPESLPYYLDPETTCFLTRRDDRADREVTALRALGYPLESLPPCDRSIEPATVLSKLCSGDPSWRELVPSSVAAYLDELDLASRLGGANR